jgi:DcmR-like sensory protein
MAPTWTEFLRGHSHSAHAVEIYAEIGDLASSVASYLSAGFEGGEPALVVATEDHLSKFLEALASVGWDTERIDGHGLLLTADADATLAAFMSGASPSAAQFEWAVGGLLDRLQKRFPDCRIRAFGEMVDVLCERGQPAAALALEELWNDLARRRDFSLLCGYHLDVFDRASQVWPLPALCRLHSRVLPAHDSERLARAVDRALAEVLGPAEAGKVYVVAGEQAREDRVPLAQHALMWVSANMPVLADRILATARQHYLDDAVVAASA